MVHIRRFIIPLALILLLLSCAKKQKPNILFILTDDQSFRTVSCYEGSNLWAKTPHIDKLASTGTRFTDAYVGVWCAPARAMILTGKMPHAINGLDFTAYPKITYDEQQFRMWPEVFKENGYTTALIGKWHLGSEYGHGKVWDHSIIWNHSESEKAGEYFTDQKLRFDGGDFTPVGGYSTENYTRYAAEFIRRDHDKPWMLWLCYDAAHAPHTPSEKYKDLYDGAGPIEIPTDVYPPRPTKPSYMRDYAMLIPGPDSIPVGNRSGLPLPSLVRKYQKSVQSLDDGVGELMETLRATGQLENTIVIFTSDQGLAMGHHGMTIKVAPYDDNIRAPLIVKLPDDAGGKICKVPVQGIDLIPALFEYAGIPLPWEMNGKSLLSLVRNPESSWGHPVVLENFSMTFGKASEVGVTEAKPNQEVDWWISLREGKYKYIRTLRENEIEELYDLEKDPHELTNLAVIKDNALLLARFRDKLTEELKATKAGLVDHWPEPKTKVVQ